GIKPDGTFQDPGMNSFNHYAYGAIGDWMYRVVGGLDTDPNEPGYKHVLIQPEPGGGLTYARADLHTMYGEAGSGWKFDGGRLVVNAAVPPNAHGTVRLPGATLAQVTESGKALSEAPGVTASRQDGPDVIVEIGSGQYAFAYPATVQSASAAE
ncbi:MAG TPA: alpha-L-rhamnosidase C-terminal domain-containing protein, partial [Rhodothermales bacterium]|nr:alpha-L-rhamnosidase C-terminal domain-containing protein [Rhodothermales bacterium]